MKTKQQIVHATRHEHWLFLQGKTTTAACGKSGLGKGRVVVHGGPINCPQCLVALSYSLNVTRDMAREHPEVFAKADYYTLGAVASPNR